MAKTTDIKEIKLVDGEGVEFTAYLSAFTSAKMERAQTLLGGYLDKAKDEYMYGYYDPVSIVDSMVTQFETLPDAFKEKEEFKPLFPMFDKYEKEELSRAKLIEKLMVVIKNEFTYARQARNVAILRELVRLMTLESGLDKAQIELIKSDAGGEFWGNQDAVLLKDTGEFFRQKVLDYTNRN